MSAVYTEPGGGGSKETDARSSHRESAAAETGSESRVRVPAPATKFYLGLPPGEFEDIFK
jgi:hypothetical protein